MAIIRELIIKHLCEHCNKEFDLLLVETRNEFGVNKSECPYCHRWNNIWITVLKEDIKKLGDI